MGTQTQGPTLEPIATQSLVGQSTPFRDAIQRYFNNLTGLLEYPRTANVFHTASLAADGAIWTPSASTLKFRLMGFDISVTSEAAISGGATECVIALLDGSTDIGLSWTVYIPAASVAAPFGCQKIATIALPGNGILSAAANNVLTLDVETSLTTGKFIVNAWGTEE